MTARPDRCPVLDAGSIELHFYGELDYAEREDVERHLAACGACREALEELAVIRAALATRPVVASPPGGDWSGFMARLDDAVAREAGGGTRIAAFAPRRSPVRTLAPWLAMAAMLAIATIGVVLVLQSRTATPGATMSGATAAPGMAAVPDAAGDAAALSAVGHQHLERSKLVLLGLATKDAAASERWDYERELASRLLADTRLYRRAAEERGLDRLAGIMRDLEVVLLQTAMTEDSDPEALSQIQRIIRRRDLLQKVDSVRTSTGI
jgi:hypothetical protein